MLRQMRKGQSTAEYAIVIGLVLAAAIGMQVYVKRGIQGKFKDASDAKVRDMDGVVLSGEAAYGVNSYTQYEPQYSTSTDLVSTTDSTEKTIVSAGGGVERKIEGVQKSSREGRQETLNPAESE